MMGGWGALAGPLIVTAAGGVAAAVLGLVAVARDIGDWWRVQRGRRRVRAVVEQETARHVTRLVPGQRRSSDLPPWADLVDQRGGDD